MTAAFAGGIGFALRRVSVKAEMVQLNKELR